MPSVNPNPITTLLNSPEVKETTKSFQKRLNALEKNGTLDVLKGNRSLGKFLSNAIHFLTEKHARPLLAKDVAHYLMGKVDYLPPGLEAPIPEIDRKSIRGGVLHDLLKSNRYFFSNSESYEKTILKLRVLSEKLNEKVVDAPVVLPDRVKKYGKDGRPMALYCGVNLKPSLKSSQLIEGSGQSNT